MLGGLNTNKSWDVLLKELQDELRKWGVTDYLLPYKGDSQRLGKVNLTLKVGEREKTVSCAKFTGQVHAMERNLSAIVQTVRATRLADQRGIGSLLADVAELLLALPEYDPYRVLGVPKGSSPEEIRKAYHRQMNLYHPDKMQGSRLMYDVIKRAAEDLGV